MSWIYLTTGKPGSGKSLDTARIALGLFKEYTRQEKRFPKLPRRVLYSNIKFSKAIEKDQLIGYKGEDGLPLPGGHLKYWNHPKELYDCRDVDIIWDEISRHLPPEKFADCPEDLKELFAYHRKRGIRLFCNAQDFKMVDIAFRRMCTHAYIIKKMIGSRDRSVTLPPVKMIWGIIKKSEFDPTEMDVQGDPNKLHMIGRSKYFFIRKKYIEAYDTGQETAHFDRSIMVHNEAWCNNPECPLHGKNRGKPKISHTAF